MTIHATNPFADANPDPARRLRGRLGSRVTLWTAGTGDHVAGLTVSSVLVATGEPAHLLALLDPDCDLMEILRETGRGMVHFLDYHHADLAEAFAGAAPAPGGAFRLATWVETAWGPRLTDVGSWAGVRVVGPEQEIGWSVLVDTEVDHSEISDSDDAPLHSRRGRYVR